MPPCYILAIKNVWKESNLALTGRKEVILMRMARIRTLFTLLAALMLLTQGAFAAEAKSPGAKPKYKKVTGQVVSVSQDSIVIKSKTKGMLTMAVTKTTDMADKPAKAGDKATVNYRAEKSGNTATRIAVAAASDKPAPPQVAPAAAPAKASK